MTAHLTEPVYYRMPRKILVYVLALCIFAMIENYLLMEQKPCPVSKPSAVQAESYMRIDFSSALPCPAERKCS